MTYIIKLFNVIKRKQKSKSKTNLSTIYRLMNKLTEDDWEVCPSHSLRNKSFSISVKEHSSVNNDYNNQMGDASVAELHMYGTDHLLKTEYTN
jgi:hypothetical protein